MATLARRFAALTLVVIVIGVGPSARARSAEPGAGAVTVTPTAAASPAVVRPNASPADRAATAAPMDPAPVPRSPLRSLPAARPGTVPILYYHRVQAPTAAFGHWSRARQQAFLAYDVLPTAFAAQLDWLVAHGYTTILPRDLADHWDRGTPLPPRPVIISFDDGSRDWVRTVLPMLRQRHMVAEFYLTLSAIARRTISWRNVRTLAAAGNGIGAHDVHHVQLTRLGHGRAPASAATMWWEVSRARSVIRARLGVAPDSMAYVGGGFDATLERLVQKAGYRTARSIVRGVVQRPGERYALRVVRIGVHDDVTDVVTGAVDPAMPTFAARMRGVSDQRRRH